MIAVLRAYRFVDPAGPTTPLDQISQLLLMTKRHNAGIQDGTPMPGNRGWVPASGIDEAHS